MKSSIRAIALGLCATAIFLSAVGSASATEPSWHLGEAEIPAGTTANVFRDVTVLQKEVAYVAVGNRTLSGGGSQALIDVGGLATWYRWQGAVNGINEYPGAVLESVACPAETFCLAVGYYAPSLGTRRALTARMNYKFEWTIEKGPVVGTDEFTELNGLSCPSIGGCQAVGRTKATSTSTSSKTLAMQFNGLAWEQVATPSPGAGENRLTDLSCVGGTCMAVGQMGTSTLSESYNGTEWKQVGVSAPGSFEGVSCTASNACTAVGSASGKIIARRWSGTAWVFQSPVFPAGSTSSTGADVSCTTATSCVAAGSYVNASGSFALAERWNGTTWSQDSTPTPAGSSARSFLGIQCFGPVLCAAVGSATFSGVVKPLPEWYS